MYTIIVALLRFIYHRIFFFNLFISHIKRADTKFFADNDKRKPILIDGHPSTSHSMTPANDLTTVFEELKLRLEKKTRTYTHGPSKNLAYDSIT